MSDQAILILLGVAGAVGIFLFIRSFKTYTIPVESFRQQFAGMDRDQFVEVTVKPPKGRKFSYKTFPLHNIHCIDKAGDGYQLTKTPSLELRVTDIAGKRTVFIFDTIFVSKTDISGERSRFLGLKKTIALDNIAKIEIQDSKKRFRYVN